MLVYSEKFDKLFKSSKLYQSGVLDKLRQLADSKRKHNKRSYDYNDMSLDYSYVGGGAILDSVMGKEIKDVDFFYVQHSGQTKYTLFTDDSIEKTFNSSIEDLKLICTPVADRSFEYQGYKIQIINGSENIKTTINSIGNICQVKSMDKTKLEPFVSCQSCLDFDLTICQIQYDIENDQVRVSPEFIKSFEKKNFSLTKEALEDLNFRRSFNQFYRITKYIKKGFDFDPISMFKLSCKLFNQPANLNNFDSMVAFCFSDEDPLNYREALKINIDVERNKMKLLDKIEDLKKINSEEANKGYIL